MRTITFCIIMCAIITIVASRILMELGKLKDTPEVKIRAIGVFTCAVSMILCIFAYCVL